LSETISNPDLPPNGQATILAQLRYTTPESYLVYKGEDVHRAGGTGYAQFHTICADLVQRAEFRGENFSHGDQQIAEKAATTGSPGNAETWRMIGTSHHLETVIDQIANLP
jgi:hypothetical protein